MTSLNEQVNLLHASYCTTLGVDLPMTATRERWWFEADKAGMMPEDVALCIRERLRIKRRGGMAKGVELRHVCGDDVRIDELLVEAAVLRAAQRKVIYSPNKTQALRDIGLPDEPPTPDAVKAGDMELIKALRRAAG